MPYSSFADFITTARSHRSKTAALNSFNRLEAANAAQDYLPQEGVAPAFFPGHHIYVKLDLRVGLLTSSENAERKKSITLLADLVEGVRNILHGYDGGALLEAQGPVVHGFLPDDLDTPDNPRIVALAIRAFVEEAIRPRAGDDFRKVLIAYCHGQSLFVATVDLHGDNSVVSLAPAANAPAKVLWANSDRFPSGSILEVECDGGFRILTLDDLRLAENTRSREMIVNCANHGSLQKIAAKEMTIPFPSSPDSPTVEEPHESFSISVRADMDGFTNRVRQAFGQGRDAAIELAHEFYAVMVHAREFSHTASAIHLPWAGDCFNLLIAVDDRNEYQKNRKRLILEILPRFADHMRAKFPNLKWSYSCAAGDVENAQKCNTLVSRIEVGDTSLLLATGLPVERSLQGLAQEGPCAHNGVLWKGDVEALAEDLKSIIKPCSGGESFRHFAVGDIGNGIRKSFFIPPKPAYDSPVGRVAPAIAVPTVRPYSNRD